MLVTKNNKADLEASAVLDERRRRRRVAARSVNVANPEEKVNAAVVEVVRERGKGEDANEENVEAKADVVRSVLVQEVARHVGAVHVAEDVARY